MNNCKPGDTAIVVADVFGLASFVGTVVTVRRLVTDVADNCVWPHPLGKCQTWEIADPVGVRATATIRGAHGMRIEAGSKGVLFSLPDAILRPIRDQPGEDEMLCIAGSPVCILA